MIKLDIELVPSTSWTNNVRAIVTKTQWDKIRSTVAAKAYYICEICGGVGPKHPVECHEVWSYNDKTHMQKLERMIALCPNCHMVKHIGYAEVSGRLHAAIKHLMKINKITKTEADKFIKESFIKWNDRSKNNWTVDISHLKDYGIDISKLKKVQWTK